MQRARTVDEYLNDAKQWRMTSARDIRPAIIQRYVAEAIRLVDSGREIKAVRNRPVVVPDELRKAMRRCKGATAAFKALRPGQQREYAGYVAEAKRDDTKQRGIRTIMPLIVAGRGLNDKYR